MSEVFITDMLAGERALRNAAREARSRRIVRSPSARTALAVAQDLASDSLSALEWVDVCAQPWRYRQSVTVTLGYLRAGYDPQFASILGTAMVDLHLVEMRAKSRIDREAESIRAVLRAYRAVWPRHPDCIQINMTTRFQKLRLKVFSVGSPRRLWAAVRAACGASSVRALPGHPESDNAAQRAAGWRCGWGIICCRRKAE